MSPTIRRLQAEDAAAYRPLRLRALTEDPAAYLTSAEEFAARPLSSVADRLRPSQAAFTLGLFMESELVGIATLLRAQPLKQRHRAEIAGVYMAPEARGRGLARRLIEELIWQARQMEGVAVLGLAVTETQLAARALYGKLGFEVWGVQPDALRQAGAPLTELHLQLALMKTSAPTLH